MSIVAVEVATSSVASKHKKQVGFCVHCPTQDSSSRFGFVVYPTSLLRTTRADPSECVKLCRHSLRIIRSGDGANESRLAGISNHWPIDFNNFGSGFVSNNASPPRDAAIVYSSTRNTYVNGHVNTIRNDKRK